MPTNQGNTAKTAINRISDVYRDGGRAGREKVAKPGGAKVKVGGGQLPNVATVARFAIERERLAREMGVDELGGPATLGVVNVGAASAAHGQQQQQGRHGLDDKGGGRGSKQTRNRERGGGRGSVTAYGSRGGGRRAGHNLTGDNGAALPAAEPDVVAERRSAGELLLEKLESVAEARSIESAGGLGGSGDRTEEQARGNWHTEEESAFFNDPAGERGGGAGGAGMGAAWGAAPVAGELSTTESAFLERSRLLNGLDGGEGGGDSLFGQHFAAGFRDESSVAGGDWMGGGGGSSAAHAATIGALRDRLATLEGENVALRARARRGEEERAAEATRGDRAIKKLAQV